jgi:hypothetical protein
MFWAAGKKTPKPERIKDALPVINQITWGFSGCLIGPVKSKKNRDKTAFLKIV